MSKVKLYIVDDHAIVRDGLKMMLGFENDIEVIGDYANSQSLFKALKEVVPDLILLDITLPGLNGIEITKIVNETYPSVKVLMLSSLTNTDAIINSIKAGACGFLSKDTPKDELMQAITAISNNKRYVGSSVAETVFNGFLHGVSRSSIENEQSPLTEREVEIVQLFSEGLLYKEIADRLDISIKTVESHKANIMKKLELKSTVELVKYAIKNGLVEL